MAKAKAAKAPELDDPETRGAVEVQLRHIDTLIPYANNARTHSSEQVAQLAAAIEEFGFTNPLIADEQGVVAGHGRLLAVRQLMKAGRPIRTPAGVALPDGHVPVIDCSGWSDTQRRAYVIADNQLALNAGWNNDLLKLELGELAGVDYDLHFTGFSTDFLGELGFGDISGGRAGADPEETPEPPVDPVTRPGDVWVLGRHRLLCGDSTVATDVERALAGGKPHLMVTDPPYGVEYDANFRNGIKRADGSIVTARAIGKVLNDDRADWREAWALFPGEVAYVWCASLHVHEVAASLHVHDFELRSQIIWAKQQFAIGRGHYHWQHEPCWYAVKKGATGHWQGARDQATVWQIDKPHKSETGHSTQKPVECMKRPIENNSAPGDSVYEPFSGSGTTIIAGEMTGRTVYAIELSPAYVDVAVSRWETFTGQTATLEGDGRTFSELQAERIPAAA